jgi:hypothetical protein
MEIPFVGGAYEGRSKELNAQRSINLIPVVDQQDAKNIVAMYGSPGNTEFSAPATTAVVRAMHVMGSKLYAVVGAVVYEIATTGVATSLGSITTSTGLVSMDDNGTQVLIVDGTTSGYIATTETLTAIADADYPALVTCKFFDGYFIGNEINTGKVYISGLYDGTSWDALEYATAEASPDNLVCLSSTKQNVWMLGVNSTEVYYNSGNTDFPFARVPGAVTNIGCAAAGSPSLVKERIYWLTDKGTVARSLGYSFETVSTKGIEYQISTYGTISDAQGFYYILEGRYFYVLSFPTEGKTWVLDVDTLFWHEWQSLTGSTAGMFRGNCSAEFVGKMLVGDRATGQVHELSMSVYTDGGLNIRRIRRTQVLFKEVLWVVHALVEIDFQSGVGLDVDEGTDGYDPQVLLQWSDDGGNTWSTGWSVSLGKFGEFNKRQRWLQLGQSRNRIYQVTIESPVEVVMLAGYGDLIASNG